MALLGTPSSVGTGRHTPSLREYRWEPATSLCIPADWPGGVYLGRLSQIPAADGANPWESYTVFNENRRPKYR